MTTPLYDRHELSKFLSQKMALQAEKAVATMTSMGRGGKWIISDSEYPKFLDLLNDYLFVKGGKAMAFVEQPRKGEPKPLLIDLDFRYPSETRLVRTFTLEQIRSFCHMLMDGLQIFFDVEGYEYLRFFVTLRPQPYVSGQQRKDGVHIMCPDIALCDEKQKVIRNWMLSQDAVKKCFADTNFINEPADIYDESMTRKQGWIFYGESKPNTAPYELKAVFKYLPEQGEWEDEEETAYTSRELMELLSVRYNIIEDENVVKEDQKDHYEAMKTWGETVMVARQEAPPVELSPTAGSDLVEALNAIYGKDLNEEEKKVIRRLVMDCLSVERAEKYEQWIRVGWCLHNISPSEENFQLWMDFSAKSSKASGNDVGKLKRDWMSGWRKHDDGPRLSERSLRKWARDDNKEAYKAIEDEFIGEYISQRIEPTHFHIAQLMKKMYGSNYIASLGPRATDWYKYEDDVNMWKKLYQGVELSMKVCTEVAGAISDAASKLFRDSGNNAKVREQLQEKGKQLLKVQTSLFNNGFTNSVMKMAEMQFYEEDFHNKLNVNPNLFACANGMIELRVPGEDGRDHVVFRQGRPEDFMSFLAGQNHPAMQPINYVPYNAADPRQAEIADFFSKLFPDPELRRYTLRLLASCLEGMNREQCFYVATGVGGNGKSKLVELMRMTFGDYQTAMQSTVLTRKRPESGAANPDIMAAKSKRFIYMQEPDDKEPINTSRMKQFSGEDMVEARALYGDQEQFIIMGKLFMMCNKLPPVTTMDRGTWRRIRVIEFQSKFVSPDADEYKAGKPNVFLIDPMLDKKLREWREPFLALLVHIYETEYIPFALHPVPAAVMKASNKYKEDFDVCARFISERVREPITIEEKMECKQNPINSNKIKTAVSAWKKEARVDINTQDLLSRLMMEFGEPRNGKEWPTIKVFGSEEAVVDWDAAHAANSS
jgi:P4 family phage/plasmid primase-like protien